MEAAAAARAARRARRGWWTVAAAQATAEHRLDRLVDTTGLRHGAGGLMVWSIAMAQRRCGMREDGKVQQIMFCRAILCAEEC
jgi:hypothetical protein